MINALNLIWIIPLSLGTGVMFMGLIAGSSINNRLEAVYKEGVAYGIHLSERKNSRGDKDETNL